MKYSNACFEKNTVMHDREILSNISRQVAYKLSNDGIVVAWHFGTDYNSLLLVFFLVHL